MQKTRVLGFYELLLLETSWGTLAGGRFMVSSFLWKTLKAEIQESSCPVVCGTFLAALVEEVSSPCLLVICMLRTNREDC